MNLSSLLMYRISNLGDKPYYRLTDYERLSFIKKCLLNCLYVLAYSYVSKLSDSIRVKKDNKNTMEDVEKFKKCSPEFFWIIRDRTLQITDVNDQPCDIKTYLGQKVCVLISHSRKDGSMSVLP